MNGITSRLAHACLVVLIATSPAALHAADDDVSAPAPAPSRAADLAAPVLLVDADHPVAAPFVADLDGDGKLDLLVGEFRPDPYTEAGFIAYHRRGDGARLQFDAGAALRAGDKPATVPAFCYTGSAPQLVDFDGDGALDLVSAAMIGRQHAAALRVFPGRGAGRFDKPFDITFIDGPAANPKSLSYSCYNVRAFVCDWDGDGDLDIIAGMSPRVWLVRNIGNRTTPRYAPAEPIMIDGQPIRASVTSVYVADWDGDGRADLIVGENGGSVSWYRNTAPRGEPALAAGQMLVPPTRVEATIDYPQGASYARPAQPATAARICVADITGDGRADLILGDRVYAEALGPPETAAQTEERKAAQLRTNAASDALRELEQQAPPTTDEARAAREAQIEAARADARAAYNALQQLRSNRYERHGSVWLYERLAK